MLTGVSEGLSRHLDIDPLLIRVVFGALTVFGGAGIILYVLAWLTIPEEDAYDSIASRALHRDPGRTMEVGLALAGIAGVVTLLGAIGFATPRPFAVIVVSVVALVLFTVFSRRRGSSSRSVGTPYGPYPPAGTGTGEDVSVEPVTTDNAAAPVTETPRTDTDAEAEATTPIPTVTPEQRASEVTAWWQRSPGGAASMPPGGIGPSPYRPAPPPPRAPKPKSRLTPITLAVMALTLGGIWFADAAGAHIHPSVYPGSVLALTAASLLLGTWYGRAKLLIPIGLLSAALTAAITVIGPGPYGERIYEPATSAAVQSTYEHGAGRMVVNLDGVRDVDALDGRTIHVDSRVGLVQVVVPTSVDAQITSTVDGGQISGPAIVQSRSHGGEEATMDARRDGRPLVTIDVQLKFGQIEIFRFECRSQAIAAQGKNPTQDLSTMTWKGDDRDPAACN